MLFRSSIEGATRLLINISGPENVTMHEVREIMTTIKSKADPSVDVIHGLNFDPSLGENIKVTVIATGFHNKPAISSRREDVHRPVESSVGEIISIDRFKEMVRGPHQHHNDGYYGIVSPKDFRENLELPAALRRYNPEAETAIRKEA